MIVEAWIKAIQAIMQHSSAQLCSGNIEREEASHYYALERQVAVKTCMSPPASGLGLGAQLSERQRLNVLPPQRPLFTPRLDLTVGVWKACRRNSFLR